MNKFDDRLFYEEPKVAEFAADPGYPKRSKFADDDEAVESPAGFAPLSVAWALEKYYNEWRPRIGLSQGYTMHRLQRSPIGRKMAPALKASDIIAHCQMRVKQPIRPGATQTVQPQTVMQDITYLRVVLDYASSGWDMPEITAKAIDDALPKLAKFGLIAKSRPRDRRPTGDEFKMLEEDFAEQAQHGNTKLPMAELQEFQVWSARRISETCRILFVDISEEKRTVIVRDMKDPKKKKGNDVEVPLLGRAWEIVVPRLAAWKAAGSPAEARIFPYVSKSVGASYTRTKKKLGIKNLRLHDLRREAASRLFEAGYSVQEVMLVTGHKTPMLLLRVYTKLKPEDLHQGPAAKRGLKPEVERVALVQYSGDRIKDDIHGARA